MEGITELRIGTYILMDASQGNAIGGYDRCAATVLTTVISPPTDEHAIIYNKEFREQIKIGDKLEIIPNHICPVCNLYDTAYLVSRGKVVAEIPVVCRGKLQ